MIIVDSRVGSGHLVEPLRATGLKVRSGRLSVGDIAFLGRGPNGPLYIGVEIKSVNDVLDCITSGRFASNQLPGLVNYYDQAWLLMHGRYRASVTGTLDIFKKDRWERYPYKPDRARTLEAWLLTVQIKAGCRVTCVDDEQAAVHWLASLYHWWTDKEFEKHHSHRSLYQDRPRDASLLSSVWSGRQDPDTLLRRMSKELPKAGWQRSLAIEKHFNGSIRDFITALSEPGYRWDKIEGFGPGIRLHILRALGHIKET